MKIEIGILLVLVAHIYASTIIRHHNEAKQVETKHNKTNEVTISEFVETMGNLPIVGTYFENGAEYLEETIATIDKLSFGLISSILKSIQPCTIDIKNGLNCKGLSEKGFNGIMEDAINGLPSHVLPDFAKTLVINFIHANGNAIMESIVGDT